MLVGVGKRGPTAPSPAGLLTHHPSLFGTQNAKSSVFKIIKRAVGESVQVGKEAKVSRWCVSMCQMLQRGERERADEGPLARRAIDMGC